jgi:hypothetical protein
MELKHNNSSTNSLITSLLLPFPLILHPAVTPVLCDAIMPSKTSIVPSSASALKIATRPSLQCIYHSYYQTRSFSASFPLHRMTRRRRKMEEWLTGPGRVFRNPLPGSTNYLNAYSREGELLRARDQAENGEEQELVDQEESNDLDLDERAEAEKQFKANAAKRRRPKKKGLPPAKIDDLRPFPLNKTFHSESVLSEEFREAIYLKVVEDKMTVRSVSAELGVTMERVGAVVRMKQMERDWLRQVSD